MGFSTAVSVASFSVVLAETFTAVMMSTLVPATFIEVASTAKRLAQNAANPGDADTDDAVNQLDALPGVDGLKKVVNTIATATGEPTELQMLLPKTATIDAEFEFHGSESYAASVSGGAQVKVVTVSAGYSALYETSSSNKVKLHIEFASVPVQIGDESPSGP